MKKIIILSQSLKINSGGGGKVVSFLSNKLNANITLCLYDAEDIAYDVTCNVEDLELGSSSNIFMKLIRPFQRFYKIKRLKKKLSPDVTISLPDNVNILNILTKTKNEKVIIRSDYSKNSNYRKGIAAFLLIAFQRLLYEKADIIVANSEGVKSALIETLGLVKAVVIVINNPIDTSKISSLRTEPIDKEIWDSLYAEETIVHIGRLSVPKNQIALLKIYSEYRKKTQRSSKLIILGDGPLRSQLVLMCRNLGLSYYTSWDDIDISSDKDVYFMGFQSNPYKYLNLADLFVFTSIWEGFPNGVLDALSCGVPILSSDCRSGPREILAPNTDSSLETKDVEYAKYGVLMPVVNNDSDEKLIEQWSEVMLNLFNDKNMLTNYMERSIEQSKVYDVNEIINNWELIING